MQYRAPVAPEDTPIDRLYDPEVEAFTGDLTDELSEERLADWLASIAHLDAAYLDWLITSRLAA